MFAASELFHSYLANGLTSLLRHPLQIRLCGPSLPKGFRHRSQCRLSVGTSSPFMSRRFRPAWVLSVLPGLLTPHSVSPASCRRPGAGLRAYQIADERLVVRRADHIHPDLFLERLLSALPVRGASTVGSGHVRRKRMPPPLSGRFLTWLARSLYPIMQVSSH